MFLALLGVIMAVLSFMMDRGISMCNKGNNNNKIQTLLCTEMFWTSLVHTQDDVVEVSFQFYTSNNSVYFH